MYLLSIPENILLFISGAGILQAIFISTLIYFHPKSEKTNTRFLALYIICISLPMLLPVGQFFYPWQTTIFFAPFTLLQGPLLYLYVRSFKEVITWKKAWPHFLLFAAYIFMISYVSVSVGSKYPPTKGMPAEVLHSPVTLIPISLRYIQMLTYFFLSYKALKSYQRSIQHLFSETSKINLSWVKLLISGYILLIVVAISLYSVVLRYPEYFSLLILVNAAIVTPYIYMAAYKGIYQPALWQAQTNLSKEKVEEEMQRAEEIEVLLNIDEPDTVQKTKTESSKIEEILEKIIAVVKNGKLYQEPELTLQQLADKINFPSYLVSQAINEGLKKNFYELVNGYRVEQAKLLLADIKSREYTVLSVGFEAGFNSKTTFNTVFKKFTGMTPTEFRNQEKIMSATLTA